ncbi:helix-turn-helix transcriptional regulator [Flavitalea flava]
MGFEVKNKDGDSLYKENPLGEDPGKNAGKYSAKVSANNPAPEKFRTESFSVPLPFGTIQATQWFFDGIKMSFSESVFNKPMVLDWKGDSEMITMHFNLKGKVSILDKDLPQGFELSANQHNMFYGKEAEGQMKVEELNMSSFLIQFSRDAFLKIAGDGNDALQRFADRVGAGKPVAFSEFNLNIDLNLQNCIRSILHCKYSDLLKRMFFLSRSIEMLVLQAESFDRSMDKKLQYIKKDYDKERLLFARDYLIKNLECPPTLTELSKIAGINEYKLKRGFKETFNQTVFEYLSDTRLEMARIDLLEKKKSLTEIAFALGYSSLQHFSAAFKKKFGISPGKIR